MQSLKLGLFALWATLFCGIGYAATPISSCEDLIHNISINMAGTYYLNQDIDCEGLVHHPIPGVFSGSIDGQGYSLYNLTIKNRADERGEGVGLFRSIKTIDLAYPPKIENLNFVNVQVLGPKDVHRGLIAAEAHNVGINNIKIEGLIITEEEGFPSRPDRGATGGLVGYATLALIENVHLNNIAIQKNAYGGGLLGIAHGPVNIAKSSVTGLVSKSAACSNNADHCAFGGLIGSTEGQGTTPNIQGLRISESFVEGVIHTKDRIGGLIGFVRSDQAVEISNSYAQVDLLPQDCETAGRVTNCKFAGGLIGHAQQDPRQDGQWQKPIYLEHVYVAGKVKLSSDGNGRAIIGHEKPEGGNRVAGRQSYYDKQVTDKKNAGDAFSVGLTTVQMQDPYEYYFATWDRTIWQFEEGEYPKLHGKKIR